MNLSKRESLNDSGMTTISYVLATGLSLVVISWSTMFVVFSYTRAAVRGASERASRAGIVEYSLHADAPKAIEACNSVFQDDIAEAIKGEVAKSLTSHCEIQGNEIHVISHTSVSSLTSLFPNMEIEEDTFRPFEKNPSP